MLSISRSHSFVPRRCSPPGTLAEHPLAGDSLILRYPRTLHAMAAGAAQERLSIDNEAPRRAKDTHRSFRSERPFGVVTDCLSRWDADGSPGEPGARFVSLDGRSDPRKRNGRALAPGERRSRVVPWVFLGISSRNQVGVWVPLWGCGGSGEGAPLCSGRILEDIIVDGRGLILGYHPDHVLLAERRF